MARKCFMCGRDLAGTGILCEKCDKPRKPKAAAAPEPAVERPGAATSPAPSPAPRPSAPRAQTVATAAAADPFPKAPVVPFPVESASPAITSVVNILVASGAASVLIGADKSVKFVSDEAKKLFDAPQADFLTVKFIEAETGIRIGDLSVPASAGVRLRDRNMLFSLVPMSGGASGAVLIFRGADPLDQAHASFVTYLKETVFGPLRALGQTFTAAAQSRPSDPLLGDAAATIEQVLSSLELAPGIQQPSHGVRPIPKVSDVVRRVADRFVPFADMKGVQLQVDVQDLEERFRDHEQLSESLAILMENALHYVPGGGQVVIGLRWMEHKGKPLLLFFVMDNGALVPEPLRTQIFEPGFTWNPSQHERTGRGLFKTREFALAHAGSVWVESKTGKACTFFLRVRPDGVQ